MFRSLSSRRLRRRQSLRPLVDPLEDRRLLAVTYDVTTSSLSIEGTTQSESYEIYQDDQHVIVQAGAAPQYFNKATQPVKFITAQMYDGNDVLTMDEALRIPLIAYGGDGNDTIMGGAAIDFIYGENGLDFLYGRGSRDVLDGGAEGDFIVGGDGSDVIFGKSGHDMLFGNDGNDFIFGGDDSNDIIYGGDGNDFLQGDEGNDFIAGGNGNDTIFGDRNTLDTFSLNEDLIYGGEGDDTIYGEEGRDIIFGESGNDTIYGDEATENSVAPGDDVIRGGDDDDTIHGGEGNDEIHGEHGVDTLYGGSDRDVLYGNEMDDFLYGQDGIDELFGDLGNDFLDGGNGEDLLDGGDGNDTLQGGNHDDTLQGGEDNDLLRGGNGDDDVFGGGGDDEINGGEGDDTLDGGSGDDLIRGGDGNDFLDGSLGNDRLYGGDDDDILFGGPGLDGIAGGLGVDTIDGGTGSDRVLDFYTTIIFAKNWEDDFVDKGPDDVRVGLKNGGRTSNRVDGVKYSYDAGWWLDEEVEMIDEALKILHESTGNKSLLETSRGNTLEFIRHGAHDQTPGTGPLAWNSGFGSMHFPDDMFLGRTNTQQMSTVLHEVGHNWDKEWDESRWNDISGWISGTGVIIDYDEYSSVNGDWWYRNDAEGFVVSYGMESPKEDFATAFSAYFLNRIGISYTEARADFLNEITDLPTKSQFFDDLVTDLS